VTTPSVVIEGSSARAAIDRMCADVATRGLRISTDWRAAAPGVAYTALVEDEHGAGQAVRAALAGAQVLVAVDADREVIDRMCDDLRRLGPLDHRVGDPSSAAGLSAEEWALLDRLLAGDSLGQAAAAIHTSRRTADRRLAAARKALGVTTTAELLAAATRLRG
jgi:DNA-binding NarL/FixJ family response regulator